MPSILRRNSVIALGLAGLFHWGFMRMKHDPVLSALSPFVNDPYDAVGSFAMIVGWLAAIPSLVRAGRPSGGRPILGGQSGVPGPVPDGRRTGGVDRAWGGRRGDGAPP